MSRSPSSVLCRQKLRPGIGAERRVQREAPSRCRRASRATRSTRSRSVGCKSPREPALPSSSPGCRPPVPTRQQSASPATAAGSATTFLQPLALASGRRVATTFVDPPVGKGQANPSFDHAGGTGQENASRPALPRRLSCHCPPKPTKCSFHRLRRSGENHGCFVEPLAFAIGSDDTCGFPARPTLLRRDPVGPSPGRPDYPRGDSPRSDGRIVAVKRRVA